MRAEAGRPPDARMAQREAPVGRRVEHEPRGLAGREAHGARERHARDHAGHGRLVRDGVKVAQFRDHGEIRPVQVRQREVGEHGREAQLHGPRAQEVDAAPRTHVVIGRRRIPVDPPDPELRARLGRRDAQRESVASLAQVRREVEFDNGIGARHHVVIGELLPVQPHLGGRIESVEAQDGVLARGRRAGHDGGAVPPGDDEHRAARVRLLHGAQVVAVEDLRVETVLHQARHHGRPAADGVPAGGRIAVERHLAAGLRRLRRRLDFPAPDRRHAAGAAGEHRLDGRRARAGPGAGQEAGEERAGKETPAEEAGAGSRYH